jgi:hypothetical protein
MGGCGVFQSGIACRGAGGAETGGGSCIAAPAEGSLNAGGGVHV